MFGSILFPQTDVTLITQFDIEAYSSPTKSNLAGAQDDRPSFYKPRCTVTDNHRKDRPGRFS
jgi:hypothetical protein